jgi:hypothetical protein
MLVRFKEKKVSIWHRYVFVAMYSIGLADNTGPTTQLNIINITFAQRSISHAFHPMAVLCLYQAAVHLCQLCIEPTYWFAFCVRSLVPVLCYV